MHVRFPLSLRNVEDLLFERGIDICHEMVRYRWNRFGPMSAGDIRRQRASRMEGFRHWRWHLEEMYVKLNGEMVYLWRAVDQEGEILESYITKIRDKEAALTFMKRALKRHGSPEAITTDGLASYKAAMKELGNTAKQEIGRDGALGRSEIEPVQPVQWWVVGRVGQEAAVALLQSIKRVLRGDRRIAAHRGILNRGDRRVAD